MAVQTLYGHRGEVKLISPASYVKASVLQRSSSEVIVAWWGGFSAKFQFKKMWVCN